MIRNPQPLIGMLARLGEPLYGRSTPDGYPIDGSAWDSPGQLTTRFQIAQQLGAGAPALFSAPPMDLAGMVAPAAAGTGVRVPVPDLAASAVFLNAEPSLQPSTVQALAQARGGAGWNALWLASPEFMND